MIRFIKSSTIFIFTSLFILCCSPEEGTTSSDITYDVQDSNIAKLRISKRSDKKEKCDSILNSYDFINIDTFDLSLYMELYRYSIECGKEFATRFEKHHPDYYPEVQYTSCDTLRYVDLAKLSKAEVIELYRNLLHSQNDNCPLELMDSLEKHQEMCYELIDTLMLHIDGYVSEYFCEIFPEKCEGITPILLMRE